MLKTPYTDQEYAKIIERFKNLEAKLEKLKFIEKLKKEGCKEEIIRLLYE
jgi:hypothetical protein